MEGSWKARRARDTLSNSSVSHEGLLHEGLLREGVLGEGLLGGRRAAGEIVTRRVRCRHHLAERAAYIWNGMDACT